MFLLNWLILREANIEVNNSPEKVDHSYFSFKYIYTYTFFSWKKSHLLKMLTVVYLTDAFFQFLKPHVILIWPLCLKIIIIIKKKSHFIHERFISSEYQKGNLTEWKWREWSSESHVQEEGNVTLHFTFSLFHAHKNKMLFTRTGSHFCARRHMLQI